MTQGTQDFKLDPEEIRHKMMEVVHFPFLWENKSWLLKSKGQVVFSTTESRKFLIKNQTQSLESTPFHSKKQNLFHIDSKWKTRFNFKPSY